MTDSIEGEVSIPVYDSITNHLIDLLNNYNIRNIEHAFKATVDQMHEIYSKEKEEIQNTRILEMYYNNLTYRERLTIFGSGVKHSILNKLGVTGYYVNRGLKSLGRGILETGNLVSNIYKSGLRAGGKSRRRRIKKTTNKKKSNRRTRRK